MHRILKRGFFFEVLGNHSSGGHADENSVFNVLRIVTNCRNFFKLVTSDTFPHNPFDTDEPTVPLRYIQCILQVNKVKSLSTYRYGWVNIFYIH